MWRGAGDDRSTAELSGVVTEAGTDRRLPVEGTLSVRLGRVVHTELHCGSGGSDHRGPARSTSPDLAPPPARPDAAVPRPGPAPGRHPGRVTLPGTLDGGDLEPEDVDVSIDLIRLLRVALRVVR
jgi:hypothetical protein